MTKLYPMLFKPLFKDYLWGGRNLAAFGRDLPEEGIVAESWEIASHEDGMSLIKNGRYAGQTLQAVFELLGEDLVGSNNRWALKRNKFPLMVKLLDAQKRLSVQVHPNDAYARENEGNELGKTEMWVVLQAEPDAAIIYGMARKVNPTALREAIMAGTLEPLLNKILIKTGDHICVPSGTLHAILEGAVLVEIQQNSNTTYRVFDWNRKDSEGKSRALHIDKALDVIDYEKTGCQLTPPMPLEKNNLWIRERLCQNKYFTTDRYTLEKGAELSGTCDGSTLEIWGLLSGEADIAGIGLDPVRFVLLPARMGGYRVLASTDAVLLHTYVA